MRTGKNTTARRHRMPVEGGDIYQGVNSTIIMGRRSAAPVSYRLFLVIMFMKQCSQDLLLAL